MFYLKLKGPEIHLAYVFHKVVNRFISILESLKSMQIKLFLKKKLHDGANIQ